MEIHHPWQRRDRVGLVRHGADLFRRGAGARRPRGRRFQLVGAPRSGGQMPARRDATRVCDGAGRLRHQGRSRADAYMEARRLRGSARAVRRAARRRIHQLRALRHHAFPHTGREMPRPRLHGHSPGVVWRGVHPRSRAVRARAEEFSAAARLFEHRPRGHHGRGAGLRRQAWRARRGAAHALSRRDQAADVFLRGQRATTLRFALLPQGQRRPPHAAVDGRVIPDGHLRHHRRAAIQPVPK